MASPPCRREGYRVHRNIKTGLFVYVCLLLLTLRKWVKAVMAAAASACVYCRRERDGAPTGGRISGEARGRADQVQLRRDRPANVRKLRRAVLCRRRVGVGCCATGGGGGGGGSGSGRV